MFWRVTAALLLSASTALAAPIGAYAERTPCYDAGSNIDVQADGFYVGQSLGCAIAGIEQRRDGWFAYLTDCVEEPEQGDGWTPVNLWGLSITPLTGGKYLFDLNLGEGGYWTAFKCQQVE